MTPETNFAENDGVSIAYQVFGDGPQDLIYIPGWLSNLDIFWEEPRVARFLLMQQAPGAQLFSVTPKEAACVLCSQLPIQTEQQL